MAKTFVFNPSKKKSAIFPSSDVRSTNYLVLMVGSYQSAEKIYLREFESVTGLTLTEFDMNDLVYEDEEKTRRRMDSFFESLPDGKNTILLRNADRLNGAYTGHTNSSTRYATPQEKYFLKKLNSSETIVFLDFEEASNLDATLRRNAHLIVEFSKAAGLLDFMMHAIRKIHVHGSRFDTKRRTSLQKA